jgi:hypothetical protein
MKMHGKHSMKKEYLYLAPLLVLKKKRKKSKKEDFQPF